MLQQSALIRLKKVNAAKNFDVAIIQYKLPEVEHFKQVVGYRMSLC